MIKMPLIIIARITITRSDTMTYYNRKKVLEIIKNYRINMQAIQDNKKCYASVGVAQGGIESVMPKASGVTSDPTANEAIRQTSYDYFAQLQTDIKYLQDRLNRVPDRLRDTLDLRLAGCTVQEIYHHTKKSQATIYRELNEIADSVIGI